MQQVSHVCRPAFPFRYCACKLNVEALLVLRGQQRYAGATTDACLSCFNNCCPTGSCAPGAMRTIICHDGEVAGALPSQVGVHLSYITVGSLWRYMPCREYISTGLL